VLSVTPGTGGHGGDADDLPREVDVLVIGAGQAGLGVAHSLRRHPWLQVLVVDALPVGESWVERWESLQLFTPRRFSGLPGLRFPAGPDRTPSRLEMAEYLRSYAAAFALPVRSGVLVRRLSRDRSGFVAQTTSGPVHAQQVVLATGPFRAPYVPAAGKDLDPSVTQLHSFHYRRPSDIPPGDVLIVGGGNSAAQLALELASSHRVTVASPGPLWFLPEDVLGISMYWWTLLTGILNAGTDARVSRYIRRRGDAIVGTQLRRLVRDGRVRLLPHRVVGARGRSATLADGTVLPVDSVLWCTGFRPDTDWIDLPGAVDQRGAPVHDAGASPVRGLHWMGLPWQTRLNSSIINGVDRDARRTARRIVAAHRPGKAPD
jgi:putative flavoprotein involved in K+ transport